MLEAAFVAGVCAEGADVVLAGVLPTPGVAYLARERAASAAVISASHNLFEYNGIKLFAPGGRKIPEPLEAHVECEIPSRPGVVAPLPELPRRVEAGQSSQSRGDRPTLSGRVPKRG